MNILEIVFFVSILFTVTFNNANAQASLFPPPNDQCGGSTPQRLAEAIEEMFAVVPLDDMMLLVLQALSTDNEVNAFLLFLADRPFSRVIYDVGQMEEYKTLMAFLCDDLYYNLGFYFYFWGDLFGLKELPPPTIKTQTKYQHEQQKPKTESLTNLLKIANKISPSQDTTKIGARAAPRPGILGLFQDMNDILPMEILETLAFDLMDTNLYMQMAIDKLETIEFKRIFDYIQTMPEFYDVLTGFRNYGIPIDCMYYEMSIYLNWTLYPWLHLDDCEIHQ